MPGKKTKTKTTSLGTTTTKVRKVSKNKSKTIIKKTTGTGKDKVTSKNVMTFKTPKSRKGSSYTDKFKSKDSSGKTKIKSKEISGTKSKGTSTYTSQKFKSPTIKQKTASYVGSGTGKRKTINKRKK